MVRNLFNAFYFYLLGVALLPALILPFVDVPSGLQKGLWACALLGLSFFGAAVAILLSNRRPVVSVPPLAYIALALPVAGLLSAVANGMFGLSLFGTGFDMGTEGSFVLFAAAAMLGSLANKRHMQMYYTVFVCASLFTLAVSGIVHFTPWAEGFSLVEWPQLSFLLGAALIVAVVQSDVGERRVFFAIIAGILAVAELYFFHPVPALIVCVLLFAFAIRQAFFVARSAGDMPVAALIVAVFLSVLLVFGFRSLLMLPSDVRPSAAATQLVGGPVYLGTLSGALLGSGPDTFSVAWEKYRPVEMNQTPLWNTSFREGYDTLLTWLITLGFFGLACFLLCAVALVYSTAKTAWEGRGAALSHPIFSSSFLIVLFSFASSALYVLDLPLFLMSGAALGFCARLMAAQPPPVVERPFFIRAVCALVLVVAGGFLVLTAGRQATAAILHAQGVAAFSASEYSRAEIQLRNAAGWWPVSAYLRDASRASLEILRARAQNPNTDPQSFQNDIQALRALAHEAVEQSPDDYAAVLSEGSILTTLMVAGVPGVKEDALAALVKADTLAPTRVEVKLMQGIFYLSAGDAAEAKRYAQKALQLKPDFEPAQQLLKASQGM